MRTSHRASVVVVVVAVRDFYENRRGRGIRFPRPKTRVLLRNYIVSCFLFLLTVGLRVLLSRVRSKYDFRRLRAGTEKRFFLARARARTHLYKHTRSQLSTRKSLGGGGGHMASGEVSCAGGRRMPFPSGGMTVCRRRRCRAVAFSADFDFTLRRRL